MQPVDPCDEDSQHPAGPAPVTPIPTPPHAGAVLLFGGSFDPPTLAHVGTAASARDAALGPEAWLLFVPAARSPFKPNPPAPDADRLAMLRLAIAGLPNAAVWTDELDRAAQTRREADGERLAAPPPSYWIDTLRRARSLLPGTDLAFLIGADQAVSFHDWREARAILDLARPVVLLREPWDDAEALLRELRGTDAWSPDELDRWKSAIVDVPLTPGSATEVRRALRDPDTDRTALRAMLHPQVIEHIHAHRIYMDG